MLRVQRSLRFPEVLRVRSLLLREMHGADRSAHGGALAWLYIMLLGIPEPAERDAEGNEVNPHIPQFMSQAPWYLNSDAPGLKHQRNLKEQEEVATMFASMLETTYAKEPVFLKNF